MLVQRAKSGDLHVNQHATWGMSEHVEQVYLESRMGYVIGYVIALGSFVGGIYLLATSQDKINYGKTKQERHQGTERQTFGVALLLAGTAIGALISLNY